MYEEPQIQVHIGHDDHPGEHMMEKARVATFVEDMLNEGARPDLMVSLYLGAAMSMMGTDDRIPHEAITELHSEFIVRINQLVHAYCFNEEGNRP